RDGQSQAAPSVGDGARLVDLEEAVKNERQVLRRYAFPRVGNSHQRSPLARMEAELDPPPHRGKLDGVVNEIAPDLTQHRLICRHRNGIEIRDHLDSLL